MLTNVDIVVYVLAVMGGAERTIYSEDLAAKCYEVDPSRFGWRLEHYRRKGWPDKYIVKTALEDAKKRKYGQLVEGSYAVDPAVDGWRLTPLGASWFSRERSRIERALGVPPVELPRKDTERFLRQIRSEPLFRLFEGKHSLATATRYDLMDFLRCAPDAPPEAITRKFARLHATALLIADSRVLDFLSACQQHFPELEGRHER